MEERSRKNRKTNKLEAKKQQKNCEWRFQVGKRENGKEGVKGRAGVQESFAQVSLSNSALRFMLD